MFQNIYWPSNSNYAGSYIPGKPVKVGFNLTDNTTGKKFTIITDMDGGIATLTSDPNYQAKEGEEFHRTPPRKEWTAIQFMMIDYVNKLQGNVVEKPLDEEVEPPFEWKYKEPRLASSRTQRGISE